MQAEQSVLDRIQRKQLKWYGHLLKMDDSRWPKKIYQWIPHGRRRRGRPQQSWKNQVMEFMRSRNMEGDMAEDIHLWRLGFYDSLFAAIIHYSLIPRFLRSSLTLSIHLNSSRLLFNPSRLHSIILLINKFSFISFTL